VLLLNRKLAAEISNMIVEQFGRQTLVAMEIALDSVCERWPDGGRHSVRKRVAQSIIRCAQAGNTGLDALIEAGEHALAQPQQSRKRSAERKGRDTPPDRQTAA
jgi:hypothetical protein